MMTKKRILQHKLLSKMSGYNDEMKPKPFIGPKVKALMVVMLVILTSTFGVYYMGVWNVIGMDITRHKMDIFDCYVLGLLNTVAVVVGLVLLGVICVGIYTLYDKLVKKFS